MKIRRHLIFGVNVLAAIVFAMYAVPTNVTPAIAQEPAPGSGSEFTFPETGKTVREPFLSYWKEHGGLTQLGYPISEELEERSPVDGKLYIVQYFERAVFEYHPENRSPNNVLLSLLGRFDYDRKYPDGAPSQQASADNPLVFTETSKTLGGIFRSYWEANGGLAQQGFPISDEFLEKSELDGKEYKVQYFERAVFEHHPENAGTDFEVLLAQLGASRYRDIAAQRNTRIEAGPGSTTLQMGGGR